MSNLYKITGILLLCVLAAVAGIYLSTATGPAETTMTTKGETNIVTDKSGREGVAKKQKLSSRKESSKRKRNLEKESSKGAYSKNKQSNDSAVGNKMKSAENTSKEETKTTNSLKSSERKKTENKNGTRSQSPKATKDKTALTNGSNSHASDEALARREKELDNELNDLINDIDKEFIEVDRTSEGLSKEYNQLKGVQGLLNEMNISPNEQQIIAEYLKISYEKFNSDKQGYFRSIRESEETSQQFLNDMSNLNQQIINGAADQAQKTILKQILDGQYNGMKEFADKVSAERAAKAQ